MPQVISVENLSKSYRLGQIGTGTLTNDLKVWSARVRGKPNPLLRIDEKDQGNHNGETLWALKDISFQIEQGEALGIIGRNGAGKSTLLKILSRVTAPTRGQVKVRGRIASLLEVGTGFHPELTGRENTYLNGAILGMSKEEVRRKFDEIVDFSGVEKFIDTPVKRYSSGMYVRLAFAVAAHLEPEILLVDEVLAVGDAEFQKKCLGKMGDVAKHGRTILFVSHNMDAVLNLCPSTFVLQNGQIAYSGMSEEALQFYLRANSGEKLLAVRHLLYEVDWKLEKEHDAKIVRIEILDGSGNPKPFTQTWDELIIRVYYVANQRFSNGSFILDFYDFKQQRLLVFDSGSQIPFEAGQHHVDCYIPRFPLASGEYFLGGGLSISRSGFLEYQKDLGLLRVHGKDVFNLGRPPETKRMLFATEHYWRE